MKTGRRRAGMAGGGGQKAGEEGRPQGRRSPRQDAVSICATLSKLFRAINLRQLRSPRAIAGWLLLGGAALSVIKHTGGLDLAKVQFNHAEPLDLGGNQKCATANASEIRAAFIIVMTRKSHTACRTSKVWMPMVGFEEGSETSPVCASCKPCCKTSSNAARSRTKYLRK